MLLKKLINYAKFLVITWFFNTVNKNFKNKYIKKLKLWILKFKNNIKN